MNMTIKEYFSALRRHPYLPLAIILTIVFTTIFSLDHGKWWAGLLLSSVFWIPVLLTVRRVGESNDRRK